MTPGSKLCFGGAGFWLTTEGLADDLARLEAELDFLAGVLRAIGAMHGIRLDRFGKFLAYRSARGVGRIGGSHHLAIARDRIIAFEDLHHDRSRGHELDEVLIKRTLAMDTVEGLGILLAP